MKEEHSPGNKHVTTDRDISVSQFILHREHLHPYHLKRLLPEDFPRHEEFELGKSNVNFNSVRKRSDFQT